MRWRLLVPAIALGLAVCGWAQNDSEPVKILPLDINKGMWEVKIHTTITDRDFSSQNAAVAPLFQAMTSQQRDTALAQLRADEAKQSESLRKGSDQTSKLCPLNQGFEAANGTNGGTCTREVNSTDRELDMHFTCTTSTGAQGYEQITKFQRIDAENFSGSIRIMTHVDILGTLTKTFTGKWITDSCSGPPAGNAAKNGLHPKGPAAVADEDPNRVVAMIDGKEIVARDAWNLLKTTAPGVRISYAGGLPALLERIYLQRAIAREALELHLDRQQPWRDKLSKTKMDDLQVVQNYAGDPNIPPAVWATWVNDQQHILWQAYFDQPPTPEGKQALMSQEKEKYRITVKDADFFSNAGK